MLGGLRVPVPNGTASDNALALNEIQLALSNISSNLSKLAPVERRHVVPPAIAALVHLVFLVLIRQPIENIISAVFFTIMLTGFAWPVWTTLKPMHRRLDEVNVRMEVLQHSVESIKLAVSRLSTVNHVHDIYPVPSDTVEEPPSLQRETLEPNAHSIESKEVPQMVMQDEVPVYVEEPEPFKVSATVTPEPERDDEPPAIVDEREPTSVTLEPTVSEPPASVVHPDPIQAPAEPEVHDGPPATTDKPDPIPMPVGPSGNNELNVDHPTIFVSPAPPEPARVERTIVVPVEQPTRRPESSFGHWSSTLLEIKHRIEPLASGTLQRLPQSNQRGPFDLFALRRIALRLLMYCASIPTADFATPNGFLGPSTLVPYYPTGDLDADRNVAFTTALDCLDELETLLTGNAKAEIAAALSELAQALSDLGLHGYASSVSGFALEILRDLYTAEPNQFRSRIASVQSLRANIFVDLRQNDDAAVAGEEAVTILKEHGETRPELVYAMLNYAVLLGSTGQGEPAAAVAFELMEYIDDSTNLRPDLVLISPLCRLFSANAYTELDSDLALSEVDRAIEASRASLDANSRVVLAGALLTKSKILSSKGQNDPAYAISTEAVTLFRSASVDHPVFSFLHAHALFTHSHQLSMANRRGDSYSTIQEAVELLQNLQSSAPVATKRPLAWALYELAKYRHKGGDKQTLRNELQIAETSVSMFREVLPLDYAGLADALYLYADRMLELDNNREAATYAEESVQYFREAREASPQKYALDLIFSLSLASSCLACTERGRDALEYAKQAVAMQHERKDDGDAQYSNHLRQLLMDVVFRSTEMDMEKDALPWMQELSQLGPIDTGNVLVRRGGKPQPSNDTRFKKETSFWMDSSNSAPQSNHESTSSVGVRSPTPTLTPPPQMDKGKGKEVAQSAGSSTFAPRVDKGKARETAPENPFSPSSDTRRLSLTEEEILSPAAAAAAAQRRRDALAGGRGSSFSPGNNKNDLLSSLLGMGGVGGRTLGGATGPTQSGNEDPLSSLLGMGGRTLGGATGPSNNDPLSSLLGTSRMGGRTPATPSSPPPTGPAGRPLGSPIQQTTRAPPATGRAGGGRLSGMAGLESLLGGLGGLGPGGGGLGGLGGSGFDPAMFGPDFFGPGSDKDKADGGNKVTPGAGTEGGGDNTPRSGTWSGVGIQSKLSDDST
ncbi:hypothetical protein EDB92DRAFT_576512 [Lactarius akahatsu]|uniref:Uncharacterized protein n=1 Tax=Lactarius akahatsu TaxID=416441 RepID=A0AAD4LHM8_9AGAM|nr:hypothetical protein EDB92DRAFT_576512 [Lactarius akahatsu]